MAVEDPSDVNSAVHDTTPRKRPQRIDIGDGLLMRWSTQADTENIAGCLAEVFKWVGDHPKEDEIPPPNEKIRAAIRRLLRGNCPVMTVYDYAVVENTLAKDDENPIVACMCLQTTPGYYGKVQLQYGTPECVGSHPDYRNRGLIRRLFLEMVHPASEARGDVIQIIPGIPYFYRQFGYEYAISIAKHQIFEHLASAIPDLPKGKTEPYLLREPVLDDIPYLVQMSTPEQLQNHADLGAYYNKDYWRYTIHDGPQTAQSNYDLSRETRIIVDAKTGQDCGLVMTHVASLLCLNILTLQDPHRHQYRDALFPVLRQMLAIYHQPTFFDLKEKELKDAKPFKDPQHADDDTVAVVAEAQETEDVNHNLTTANTDTVVAPSSSPSRRDRLHSCRIMLSPTHPVTQLLQPKLIPSKKRYRLYTRIPSYANFLLKIAPTLEDRLATSCLAGISVTWHFDFFRKVEGAAGKGLEIVFREGKIVLASDEWVPPTPYETMLAARERIAQQKETQQATATVPPSEEGQQLDRFFNQETPLEFKAEFAPLTLTRLLVGDLSIAEMLDLYGECSVSGGTDAEIMLDILFPKQQHHFDLFWW
ncbi:hypothetical protein KVV02_002694 [Mortierella alpina]|uniref:Uncharacterized protein n=1 Tax=Mortierella alpina TaxID=64518 RepID=A0A9P8IEB8_MORAP|nr:hypothetical protein KVV02_002694 [Mortierella alpina]